MLVYLVVHRNCCRNQLYHKCGELLFQINFGDVRQEPNETELENHSWLLLCILFIVIELSVGTFSFPSNGFDLSNSI